MSGPAPDWRSSNRVFPRPLRLRLAVFADFGLIRRHDALAGRDLRPEPIEERKRLLAKLLGGAQVSIVLNDQFTEDSAIVYREACKLGCEGIVSKRLGSTYRRGRSPYWIKVKNPKAPAVKREAEEDWAR